MSNVVNISLVFRSAHSIHVLFTICIPPYHSQYRLGIWRTGDPRRNVQSNTGEEEGILAELSTSFGKLTSIEKLSNGKAPSSQKHLMDRWRMLERVYFVSYALSSAPDRISDFSNLRVGSNSCETILPMPSHHLLTGFDSTPASDFPGYQSLLLLPGFLQVRLDKSSVDDEYISPTELDTGIVTTSLED